ncbi:MAG: hypothetical protein BWY68_00832 [bacterium ADurb.Bin400]|nr:MAG: hypothetical protein BWY68_00832 [bacterium ADurb.Bin400]
MAKWPIQPDGHLDGRAIAMVIDGGQNMTREERATVLSHIRKCETGVCAHSLEMACAASSDTASVAAAA